MNSKKIITQPPIGIIVTLPARFFEEYSREKYEMNLKRMNHPEEQGLWYRVMKNLPAHDVLYCYTVYGGLVQHRTNIAYMWRGETMHFNRPEGGVRTFENCNGIVQCHPLVMAPRQIPMKGFQGFRYVYEEIF